MSQSPSLLTLTNDEFEAMASKVGVRGGGSRGESVGLGSVFSDDEFERHAESVKPAAIPIPSVSTKVSYGGIAKEDPGLISFEKLQLTPVTEFSKGLWTSLTSGNVQMLGAAAEAFSVATGNDKPEESIGRHVQDWIKEKTNKDDHPMGWEEAKGEGPLGVLGYLAGLTGSAVGSMAAPIMAGAVGGAAGSAVPGIGTAVGAFTGAFSAGAMLNIGETYTQLVSEGVDTDTAATAALSVGTGLGVIDTLALGKVVSKTVGKDIKKRAIREVAKQFGKGYAEGAAVEGVTETVQSAIRETTAAVLTGDAKVKERALSALHEGFAGALGGGFIRGTTQAGRAVLPQAETPAIPPAETPPAPVTPESAPAVTPEPSPQPVVDEPIAPPVAAPIPVEPTPTETTTDPATPLFAEALPGQEVAEIQPATPLESTPTSKASEPSGEYEFTGERPALPSLRKVADAEMPAELVRRSEIIENLSKELSGLPVRIGRVTGKALGKYKGKEGVVRLKQANDIPVAMHEIGHHLNKVLYGGPEGKLNTKPLGEFKGELSKIATKGESMTEGFAEFVRMYLTNPSEALEKAPSFHAAFEQKISEVPDLVDMLSNTRDQIKRYVEQPAAAKVLSHISMEEPKAPAVTFDKFYAQAIDGLDPLKRVVNAMEKASGEKLNTEDNAYELSRLFAGWIGKADEFITKGTFDPNSLEITGKAFTDIIKPVDKAGGMDNLRIYLTARRGVEKSEQGIETGLDADTYKEAIKQTETPELKQAASEIYSYNDRLLQYARDAGMLSSDQYDRIREMNKDYVPFYRVMEPTSGGGKGGSGKTMADLFSPVKRMKGSGREIIDPLESIIKNTYGIINFVDRNNVGRALVTQAKATEGSGQWVEKIPASMRPMQFRLGEIKKSLDDAGVDSKSISKEDLEAMVTVFKPDVSGSQRENILTVVEDGKTEAYQVHPELYRSMKTMDQESMGLLIKVLAVPAKALRATATALNPAFVVTNLSRDTVAAAVQTENGFLPVVDTMKGVFNAAGKTDLYHEWRRAGGESAALFSMDRTSLKKNLDDMLESKALTYVKHPVEVLRMLSETAENTTRLGEYGKARKKGKSPRESAMAAREVTLDFARIGSKMAAVNRIIPFSNAAIQGTDKIVRTFRSNPKRATVGAVSSITIPSIILYALNKDNEEWKDAPRWQKDFFWMIPTDGTPLEGKTPFIKIAKPHAYGIAFGSAVERAMEWINGEDPKAFDGLVNSFTQATIPSISIQATKPLMEIWANKSFFTGGPIVPRRLDRLSPENQYATWTSGYSKAMSRMFKRAGLRVSPMKIEHLVRGYTAGLGRDIGRIVDPVFREEGVERPTRELADVPIVGSLVTRNVGSSQSMEDFYERLSKLDQKYNDIQFARKNPDRPDPEKMTSKERREYDLMRTASRRMSDMSTKIRRIESSKQTGKQKRKSIEAWSRKRRKIAFDVMKKASKIRK